MFRCRLLPGSASMPSSRSASNSGGSGIRTWRSVVVLHGECRTVDLRNLARGMHAQAVLVQRQAHRVALDRRRRHLFVGGPDGLDRPVGASIRQIVDPFDCVEGRWLRVARRILSWRRRFLGQCDGGAVANAPVSRGVARLSRVDVNTNREWLRRRLLEPALRPAALAPMPPRLWAEPAEPAGMLS